MTRLQGEALIALTPRTSSPSPSSEATSPPRPRRQVPAPLPASATLERRGGVQVSVVICAYNEEKNIAQLVRALLASEAEECAVAEIVCVASGCTDRTVPILESLEASDSRVRVIVQSNRSGKASALALGLAAAHGSVIVVQNADTLPTAGFLDEITRPFRDPEVRLVCSHPVPVEASKTLASRMAHVMWVVHDQVCQVRPNVGEAYAVRAPPPVVPSDVFDDDGFVCASVLETGGRAIYASRATILNRVPETLTEYLQQRFRVHQQAARLRMRRGYRTSTKTAHYAIPALLSTLHDHREDWFDVVIFAVSEVSLFLSGTVAALRGKDLRTWTPIATTKLPIHPER